MKRSKVIRLAGTAAIGFFSIVSHSIADPLNLTISGKTAERVELETLVPSPDIPTMDQLSLSIDGGKSAVDGEVDPLSPAQAALLTDPTKLPMPGFSAIPDGPYIVQALPYELEKIDGKKSAKRKAPIRFTHWEFTVVDEYNHICHQKTGEGTPPALFTWDGFQDNKFTLEPDRTYFSYLRFMAHGEPDRTITGDSVRFLAFIRQNGPDTIIRFGERVYEKDKAKFSDEAKIYLDDLAQRLSHIMSFYEKDNGESAWNVVLSEPENQSALGEMRKTLWINYLQTTLARNMPDHRFSIQSEPNSETSVTITFPRTQPPLTDLALRGEAKSSLTVPLEPMSSLIKITESKEMVIVDLRHDRLFLPGSAYIRDEALPYLSQAMEQIRKMEFKREEKAAKKLLLRSYTQKLPGKAKNQGEDPKLTAVRSKVLFMVFARAGLTR